MFGLKEGNWNTGPTTVNEYKMQGNR